MNLSLYLLTVLIWGTTWIAIKLQMGPVAITLSIAYRFALAALVLFAVLLPLLAACKGWTHGANACAWPRAYACSA